MRNKEIPLTHCDCLVVLQHKSLTAWHTKGAPKHKLVVGIPFYARTFVLKDPGQFQPGQSARAEKDGFPGPFTEEDGFVSYAEMCKMVDGGWTKRTDSDSNVYVTKGKMWAGYDTPNSVLRKMEYIKEQGFGGAMIWAVDLDDFNGDCGEKWPLLTAIRTGLECKATSLILFL